jgi:hypothetical protein
MEMPSPGDAMLTNPVKERMKAGEVALGLNVRIARSGDIARIAKTTGHDFIFIEYSIRCFRWRRSAISPRPHSAAAWHP